MPKIGIMVVDDHEIVRSGLAAVLEVEEDFQVVGEAESAEQAIERLSTLKPDVVLMDLRVEGMSGIDGCRAIRRAHPEIAVLMLTSFGEDEAVMSAIMAGASGYLLKRVSRTELINGVRVVAQGKSLLDPTITRRMMERLVSTNRQFTALNNKVQEDLDVLFVGVRGVLEQERGRLGTLESNALREEFLRCLGRMSEVIDRR